MSGKKFIFLAITILLFVPACSTQPTQIPPVPTSAPLPLTEREVPRVTVDEAKAALASGAAVMVDVRSAQAFAVSHIAEAIHLQLGEIETNPTGLNLPTDQWIITYCT
jgi:hypothetical protein